MEEGVFQTEEKCSKHPRTFLLEMLDGVCACCTGFEMVRWCPKCGDEAHKKSVRERKAWEKENGYRIRKVLLDVTIDPITNQPIPSTNSRIVEFYSQAPHPKSGCFVKINKGGFIERSKEQTEYFLLK